MQNKAAKTSLKKPMILVASALWILLATMSYPFFTDAQTPENSAATVGVSLTAGTLSITHIPNSFTMTPVNIDSPAANLFSHYTNPETFDTTLAVQDGRFSGGFDLQVQVDSDYTSGSDIISKSLLGVRTIDTLIQENLLGATPSTATPAESSTDYVPFNGPVLLLDSGVDCGMGRVGSYAVFPSFRLEVPATTPAGTYTTNITYTVIDIPSDPC
jgi:hypothetical protein